MYVKGSGKKRDGVKGQRKKDGRPKKKSNMLNVKSCVSRFNSGACSRLQFLRAVRHSYGGPTAAYNDSSCSESETSQAPVPAATTLAASEQG